MPEDSACKIRLGISWLLAGCVCSIFVCVMVGVGILWIPVIQGMQGAQLFFYIQAVSAYLAPPIASVYLLAVLWPRANERVTTLRLEFGLLS